MPIFFPGSLNLPPLSRGGAASAYSCFPCTDSRRKKKDYFFMALAPVREIQRIIGVLTLVITTWVNLPLEEI
jgi:hypothetical protein